MAVRDLRAGTMRIDPIDGAVVGVDAVAWLSARATPGMLLLAHADDGVIWGRCEREGEIAVPPSSLNVGAKLRNETLQTARLFDETTEFYTWRVDEGTWCARRIVDGAGDERRYFDEPQILWGTRVEESDGGFARVADGAEGLRHAVPRSLAVEDWGGERRLRLGVRHYLEEGADGWQRVAASRLTGVWKMCGAKETD